MVKGLEALERFKQPHMMCDLDWNNRVETIEKDLKRLEELEKAFDALSKEDEKTKKLLSKEIEKNWVLQIIFEAPSIIEQLFKLGQLGKEAENRYYWGTISDSRVEKVKEFFADDKTKMFSKDQ